MKKAPAGSKKGRKILKAVLITAATLVVLSGAAYTAAALRTAGAVPVVATKPSVEATPLPTPSLEFLSGEPTDIGEDAELPTLAPTAEPIYKQQPIREDVINILIVGRDIRPEQSGRGRSDTMMLLTYNRKLGRAGMVSFMRDSWVPIEGHGWNRINAAYAFGGVGLAINTVNELFGLDIQHYVILDFTGMVSLIDQLGGIDVAITPEEADYYNRNRGMDIQAGVVHLDGEQTLIHARNRHSGGGDFERVRRQQDVMMAIYGKIRQSRDPMALSGVVSFCLTKVQTNMSSNLLFSLALEVANSENLEIEKARIPIDGSWKYASKDGRSVLAIDIEENKRFIHEKIYEPALP